MNQNTHTLGTRVLPQCVGSSLGRARYEVALVRRMP